MIVIYFKMKELIIKGTDKYIEYLNKHILEEHPETKNKKIIKKLKLNEDLLRDDDLDLSEVLGI